MPEVSDTTAARPAAFRYGAVLLCTLMVVVFAILAPVAHWSRAVVIALESVALLVVIATSRTGHHRDPARPDRWAVAPCAARWSDAAGRRGILGDLPADRSRLPGPS